MRRRLAAALVLCLATPACARNAGQVAESPVAEVESSPTPSPSPSEPPAPITLPGALNNKSTSDLTDQGASVSLEMKMADLAFDPTFVKVAPGANVKLTLKNEGELADHTFTIDSLAVDRRLAPGENTEIVVQLPTSGAFRFYCQLHVDRGMQGAFFFTEGDALSETTLTPLPTGQSASSTSSRRRTSSSSGGSRSTSGSAGADSQGPSGTENGDFFIPDLQINEPDIGGNIGSGLTSSRSSNNLLPRTRPGTQPVNTPPRVEGSTEGSSGSGGEDSAAGEPGEPGTQGTVGSN